MLPVHLEVVVRPLLLQVSSQALLIHAAAMFSYCRLSRCWMSPYHHITDRSILVVEAILERLSLGRRFLFQQRRPHKAQVRPGMSAVVKELNWAAQRTRQEGP